MQPPLELQEPSGSRTHAQLLFRQLSLDHEPGNAAPRPGAAVLTGALPFQPSLCEAQLRCHRSATSGEEAA